MASQTLRTGGEPLGRILVADDSAVVRAMVRGVLEKAGYQVEEAKDGAVAIQRLEGPPYDVVITDLQMPQHDGFEVLAAVKNGSNDTEVIVLTGAHAQDMSAAIRALRLGAHDYLTKPPSHADQLLLTVERALEKKRLKDANQRLVRELEALSRTDALTGLPNRRSFDEALVRETARADRYGVPLAFALVDLDHFKKINDTHGHQGGDAVLRHFGALAREVFRDVDAVYRYGGEEFAVLLPHTSLAEGMKAVERLRQRLEVSSIDLGPTRVQVTCSVGVAAFEKADIEGVAMVRAADSAVYAAKSGGRNRVCSSENSRPQATSPQRSFAPARGSRLRAVGGVAGRA